MNILSGVNHELKNFEFMEQFSLDKWLKDKSHKVVTRDGRKVKIVWWELKCHTPIIAAIQWNQEREDCYCYDTIGRCANNVGELDLFFADEEELTKFEKALLTAFDCVAAKAVMTINQPISFQEDVKEWSKELLNLARKELQPKFDEELDKAYKTQDDVVYRNGYAQGKQDALKAALESLPKWKKSTKTKNFDNHVLLFEDKDRVVLTTEIYEDERYIELDDLKTLPKED